MEDNLVKLMDESGYRHLINILISIRSSQQENAEKCISIWKPKTQYLKEKTVLVLNGDSYSEYVCETPHVSSDNFENDKSHWKPISCIEFEGYTEEQLREWLGLSDEELETLSNIINDAEVQTNHAWSSSKIYAELLRTLSESKKFTISEIAKIVSFSYKVVNDEADVVDDKAIYLVKNQATGTHDMYLLIDDSPSIVGNTNINLEGYIKKDDIVDSFDETATYTDDDKIFSTKASKLMYDKLNDKKINKSNIVKALDDTVTNEQIPSALATFNKINEINQFVVQEITTTGTDLNDYKTTGIYMFNGGYCPTNIPAGVNGWLIVMPSSSAVKQLWFRYGTGNRNSYETYERIYTVSQGWSEWTIYGTSKNSQIFKGYLTDGTDVNNILDNGIYNIGTGETITNLPNGAVNGWLIVYRGAANSSKQIFYRLGTTNRNDFEIYVRTGNSDGSIWSDWSMQCATKTFNKSRTELTLTDSTNFTLHVSKDVKLNNSYSIKNGICQVNIDIDCLVASSISNVFNESLPKPYSGKYMANILPLYLNSTSADASYRHITLIIEGGTSNVIYGGTVGGRYFGSFSYPVAE